MRSRNLTAALIALIIIVALASSIASHHSYDRNDDGGFFDAERQDYQRGGLAHDYFHTDQFFGREVRGFPDTAFGEDSRYDMRSSGSYSGHDKHHGLSQHEYNQRYDSGPYGAYSDMALRYGEGFVAGEGFGDEYIGDPDQLDERIYMWN